MGRAARHAGSPVLALGGATALYVSYRITQVTTALGTNNLATAVMYLGVLAGAYLLCLAAYLLIARKDFVALSLPPIIAVVVAVILILFQGAAYIAALLVIIGLKSVGT